MDSLVDFLWFNKENYLLPVIHTILLKKHIFYEEKRSLKNILVKLYHKIHQNNGYTWGKSDKSFVGHNPSKGNLLQY